MTLSLILLFVYLFVIGGITYRIFHMRKKLDDYLYLEKIKNKPLKIVLRLFLFLIYCSIAPFVFVISGIFSGLRSFFGLFKDIFKD
jgi:uncharacterized membrane protein